MTTKTTVPQTAADARALAERLAAEEHDLDQRRRQAAKAAQIAEAKRVLDEDIPAMDKAITAATAAWETAAADPTVGMVELFPLFVELRSVSARRYATVRQASATLDQLAPKDNKYSNISWRRDIHDPLDTVNFTASLDRVIAKRLEAASYAASDVVTTALQNVADEARAAVS